MKNRSVRKLVLMTSVLLVLAGCGGEDTNGAATTTSVSSASAGSSESTVVEPSTTAIEVGAPTSGWWDCVSAQEVTNTVGNQVTLDQTPPDAPIEQKQCIYTWDSSGTPGNSVRIRSVDSPVGSPEEGEAAYWQGDGFTISSHPALSSSGFLAQKGPSVCYAMDGGIYLEVHADNDDNPDSSICDYAGRLLGIVHSQ